MTDARVDSPRVAPIGADRVAELCDLLDAWRDSMPVVDRKIVANGQVTALAVFDGDVVVGGYLFETVPHANEIIALAVRPDLRLQGLGRLMCMDALFRSGKRPLVLTANDESAAFAKSVGFKIVGKRRQDDGSYLTRLGWHAPRPSDAPNGGAC